MNGKHVIGGIEIFLLAAIPAWMQSPTGTAFLHSHLSIADIIGAAYVGWRAFDLASRAAQPDTPNPTLPAAPAQEPK